jgi:hypothetical protein
MENKEREESASTGDITSRVDTGQGVQARSAVREQTAHVKQLGMEKGTELKHAAERKADELKDAAMRRTDEITSSIGARMSMLARALNRACDELRDEGDSRLADMTGSTASYIERFGAYLDGRDTKGMISDVARSARSHPAFFVGGTFAMGLLIGRFLKADEPALGESS